MNSFDKSVANKSSLSCKGLVKRDNNSRQICLFSLAIGLFWFSLYTYVPILSPYAESQGASHQLVGMILGSYGLTQVAVRIPLGILADRIGSQKYFLIIGMFLSLLSGLGMWYFTNPLLLLLFRSVAGLAASSWVVFIIIFIGFFAENHVPKAIGYLNFLNALGQITALFCGGIMAQYFGSRTTFLLGAVGGLIGLILSLNLVVNKHQQGEAGAYKEFSLIGRDKNLWSISMLAAVVQFIAFGAVFGFTPLVAKHIGASNFILGLMVTFYSLPIAFSSVMSSFFASHFGIKRSVVGGLLLMAVSTWSVIGIKSINTLIFAEFVCGFGQGMVFPLLMSLCLQNIPDSKKTTAMGLFQAICGLGIFAGPLLVGALSNVAGIYWGLSLAGLLAVVGVLASCVIVPDVGVKKQA